MYLEGKLERGIVPEESVWEHGGGVGEEGCTLYLHKMNLELLRRYVSMCRRHRPCLGQSALSVNLSPPMGMWHAMAGGACVLWLSSPAFTSDKQAVAGKTE